MVSRVFKTLRDMHFLLGRGATVDTARDPMIRYDIKQLEYFIEFFSYRLILHQIYPLVKRKLNYQLDIQFLYQTQFVIVFQQNLSNNTIYIVMKHNSIHLVIQFFMTFSSIVLCQLESHLLVLIHFLQMVLLHLQL